MLRQMIKIDEELCNGCGLCIDACHEGAIALIDGKAKLIRDDYCDGLGNCLPACPTGAISFESREALAFDPEALAAHMQGTGASACAAVSMDLGVRDTVLTESAAPVQREETLVSQIRQWPLQIKLLPIKAGYFENARLLVAADCAAFAHANFNQRFMKDKICIIGCPKLDGIDYSEKLTAILRENQIHSIHLVRMEVPCCGGLEHALKQALSRSGKVLPWSVTIISTNGEILSSY